MDYNKQFEKTLDNTLIRSGFHINSNGANELYPNRLPLPYQKTDPRLNYGYYNSISSTRSSQIYGNSSLPYDFLAINSLDTKTDDELWIETWLSKIGKIQINLNSTVEIKTASNNTYKEKQIINSLQIHDVKSSLKYCTLILDKLQAMKEFLKSSAANMSSADWKKGTAEIAIVKDEFSKLIFQFENPDTMTCLRKSIEKRRRKRETRKKKRKRNKDALKEIHKERTKGHRDINQWLDNVKEEAEQAKLEENLRKHNDCVLAEVTKQKLDTRKALSLISSLTKLRQVREQVALQRGEKVSLEDHNAFAKITERLTKIWNDAIKGYITEEQRLQKMLEQNAVEDSNVARANKENNITDEWHETFFGSQCIPSPMYLALTSAEKDLEAFIAIRKSWDTFLVDEFNQNGSKIPIGWVIPKMHTDEQWTKYLHTT